MTRVKQLTFAALVALGLVAGAIASNPTAQLAANKASPTLILAGVNEYEGQHRVAFNFTKIEYTRPG
jgi:hypothetical protein